MLFAAWPPSILLEESIESVLLLLLPSEVCEAVIGCVGGVYPAPPPTCDLRIFGVIFN